MFEWLFKYTRAEFARGEIVLAADWPLWLFATAFAVGALLLATLAWRRGRQLGWPRLLLLCALQWAMLALALLLLWQPSLLLKTLRSGENSIAIMLDDSASMATVDPQTARSAQARQVLDSPALRQLTRDYKPRRYLFDRDARAVESLETPATTGTATAVGGSVLQVLRTLQSTPLGAVVLISDGADSAGALDPDQLANIAGFGVPVHVVGIGRETMPEDLELQDVLLPEKTLPGTSLSARVTVRHDGAGVARIKAYDGQRFLGSTDLTLPADAAVTSGFIGFELGDSGYRNLRFSVDPKPGERELANNSRTRVVQVAARRASVLYVEGEPRWELKFMRRALDNDQGVRLVSLLRTSPNGYYRQGVDRPDELQAGFPVNRAALFRYDAIVIGSLPAAWFKTDQLQLLREFVSERGGSLLMLAGPNGLGGGGWGNTEVGRLLPAQLSDAEGTFMRQQGQVELTPRGRRSAMLKLAEQGAANDTAWASLPKVADYQSIGALRPAAVSLLNVRVGERVQPLLVTQPYGRGHTSILATGGTWRWQMLLPLADQRHEQFWRQLLRGLVAEVPEPFELQARSQGDQLVVRAELRDESYAPVRDATLSAVAGSGGESLQVPMQPVAGQPGSYVGQLTVTRSGAYFVDATARRGGKQLASARAVVQHDRGDAEGFSLRQNRALLEQLARATGGQYWQATDLAGLPDAVRASAAGVTRQELRALWDMPAVFLLLLLLKGTEWLLRRRWSVV